MFKKYLIYGLLGTAMGFILARIGFADYDEINKMLQLKSIRLHRKVDKILRKMRII